jgi:hypothetical protein
MSVVPDDEQGTETESHPRGTLVILAAFVIALVVLWTVVYVIMLVRGSTA